MRDFDAATIAVLIWFSLSSSVAKADITGVASKVVDGDTLYVCDKRVCEKIRLCGINVLPFQFGA
jgi:endonuclease YncB( thermonuclease family)